MSFTLQNYSEWSSDISSKLGNPANVAALINLADDIIVSPNISSDGLAFFDQTLPLLFASIKNSNCANFAQYFLFGITKNCPNFLTNAHQLFKFEPIIVELNKLKFLDAFLIQLTNAPSHELLNLALCLPPRLEGEENSMFLVNLRTENLFLTVKRCSTPLVFIELCKLDNSLFDHALKDFEDYWPLVDGNDVPDFNNMTAIWFELVKLIKDPVKQGESLKTFIHQFAAEISFYQLTQVPNFYIGAQSCLDLPVKNDWILIILTSIFLPNFLITRNEAAANFYREAYKRLAVETALRLFQINVEAIDPDQDMNVSRASISLIKNLIYMEECRPELKPQMVKLLPFQKTALTFDTSLADKLF